MKIVDLNKERMSKDSEEYLRYGFDDVVDLCALHNKKSSNKPLKSQTIRKEKAIIDKPIKNN